MRPLSLLPILLLSLFVTESLFAQTGDIRTLQPYPKVAFEREGTVTLDEEIVVVAVESPETSGAINWLQRQFEERFGIRPTVVTPEAYDGVATAIFIGLRGAGYISPLLKELIPPGEPKLSEVGSSEIVEEAYLLDVGTKKIVVAAAYSEGLFHGVTTLLQLARTGSLPKQIRASHIFDYPDYPVRWVFSQHNLRGTNAMGTLERLLDSMRFHKINGIQQSDFKYTILSEQPDFYFDSVARFKGMADERSIAIIPGVAPIGWSSGILWHDPNLAEGFPAEVLYVIEADTGRIIPDPRVSIPNGGFENVDGQGKFTDWTFYDAENIEVDRSFFRSGAASARSSNFQNQPAGNSRFHRSVPCLPHRAYSTSIWVKTEDLQSDMVQLLAIGEESNGKKRTLTYTNFDVNETSSGWVRLEARFNTLESTQLLLYCGVWGGKSGTIWWDDWEIRDAGMLNILRRDGTPLHVRDPKLGLDYVEGEDFEEIIDPIMLDSHGEFGPYHTPPTIRVKKGASGSNLVNGDTLLVSWFHPLTTVADQDVNGSVMACVSEEKLYDIIDEEATGVKALYEPANWFMGHDEIRSLNRDSSCTKRDLSAADLLADNVTHITNIIREKSPNSGIYVWSDMFDSLHNTHADYYLINGDLTGVWNKIPKDLTIVNWNSGNRKLSLQFFEKHGFKQIAAPFLPSANASAIRGWRLDGHSINGMKGMMYTTWSNDYSQLAPFGFYTWGAGPFIIHRPFGIEEFRGLLGSTSRISFRAEVLPDPHHSSDQISQVSLVIESSDGIVDIYEMEDVGGNIWTTSVDVKDLKSATAYRIEGSNYQGLRKRTPTYLLEEIITSVEDGEDPGVKVERALDLSAQ